jgi:ammonium transporter, Amt family
MSFVVALRAVPRTEGIGMDVSEHGEEAYTTGEGSILVMQESVTGAAARVLTPQTAAR